MALSGTLKIALGPAKVVHIEKNLDREPEFI